MTWDEIFPHSAENDTAECELRVRVPKHLKNWLNQMEKDYKVPPSALVRMALDFLKPKLSNQNTTDSRIASVYRQFYRKDG